MPFVITWICTSNGRTGHGPVIDSKEVAEVLAHDLNEEYPTLKHVVVEVKELEE